ncbi:MAG: PEP-CTERM sorting domain-containing protein [Lyngbya sp.]|nr:PEP-CTERM sorting domain-containing protein [Lyngbya sp.]
MSILNATKRLLMGVVGVGVMTLGIPQASQAVSLRFLDSFAAPFDPDRGNIDDGMAFDPQSGNLFISDDDFVVQVTTDGTLISSFIPQGLDKVHGLSFLPNGNLLLSDIDKERVVEFTTDGTRVNGGINIKVNPPSGTPDGVIYNPFTNTIFVTDDPDEAIYEFSLTGTLLSQINTRSVFPDFDEPEGITVDPLTGNLLIVDDSGGTNSLYEVTTTGKLISQIDLFALTGFTDPEAVTIDRKTNRLYVAFEEESRIGIFEVKAVPEPGTIFGSLTALGMSAALRKKRKSLL